MIDAYPPNPTITGTSLIVFKGAPNVAVVWSVYGTGSLAHAASITDERGLASAVFTPAHVGDTTTITVSHGT